VPAGLGPSERADLDQRLDGPGGRVIVRCEPSGVRRDLSRQLDRLIDAAGLQSEPYLGTGVVDEVLALRALRYRGKDCLGLLQPPKFEQNLGTFDLCAPANLV